MLTGRTENRDGLWGFFNQSIKSFILISFVIIYKNCKTSCLMYAITNGFPIGLYQMHPNYLGTYIILFPHLNSIV